MLCSVNPLKNQYNSSLVNDLLMLADFPNPFVLIDFTGFFVIMSSSNAVSKHDFNLDIVFLIT